VRNSGVTCSCTTTKTISKGRPRRRTDVFKDFKKPRAARARKAIGAVRRWRAAANGTAARLTRARREGFGRQAVYCAGVMRPLCRRFPCSRFHTGQTERRGRHPPPPSNTASRRATNELAPDPGSGHGRLSPTCRCRQGRELVGADGNAAGAKTSNPPLRDADQPLRLRASA